MGNLTTSIDKFSKTRGIAGLVIAICVGLFLARAMMISLPTVVLFTFGLAILVTTVLLQKTDILLYSWFILTSFILLIVIRFFPQYYGFLGTVLFWGMLGCILAAWAMDNVIRGRRFTAFQNVPLIATTLVFLIWGSISVFTAIDVNISARRFSHIVLGLATTYMFYDIFSRDQQNIKKMLAIILVIVLFISCSTVIAATHSLMSGEPIYKQIGLWFRGSNVLGGILCFCIPILFTGGLHLIKNRALKVFIASIILLALLFSFSRTAWVGTLAALVFLIWTSHPNKPLWLLLAGIGLIAIAWWFPFGWEDFFHYVTGERYTGRKTIWKAAWNIALDHPLFGVGPGNAFGLMEQYLPIGFYQVLGPQDTHSASLRNAAEMGFVSPLLRLTVIGLSIYNAIKVERSVRSQFLRLVCRGSAATFLAVLVRGMGENGSFLTPFSAAEFHLLVPYMVLALPFAVKNLEARHKDPGLRRSATERNMRI